jgi:hypothetical protein
MPLVCALANSKSKAQEVSQKENTTKARHGTLGTQVDVFV